VVDLVAESARLVTERGLVCGSFARDRAYMEMLIGCGVRYLTYMVDSAVVLKAYMEAMEAFTASADRGKRTADRRGA